jgi:hypothetical protein
MQESACGHLDKITPQKQFTFATLEKTQPDVPRSTQRGRGIWPCIPATQSHQLGVNQRDQP